MSTQEHVLDVAARALFSSARGPGDPTTWEDADDELRQWIKGHAKAVLLAVANDGAERVHSQAEGDGATADPKIGPSSLGERGLETDVVELVEAARDVIARWDSPKWRWDQHTAVFINRLRAAVDAARPTDPNALSVQKGESDEP